MTSVPPQTLDFLRDLSLNNNRDWFHAQKQRYETAKAAHEHLIASLIDGISEFEDLAGITPKECNFRINRDIRFSVDKSPYKNWLAASIAEGGKKSSKQSYYVHIQPDGQSFVAGGMYAPSAEQLAKLRQEIDYEPGRLKAVIHHPDFVEVFGEVLGDSLKSAPKGYDKNHEEIVLLRKTQFYVMHTYTDAEVTSTGFAKLVIAHCRTMKPLLDYLNEILN